MTSRPTARAAVTSTAGSRAFDDALADAGGSLPIWLVLLNLKSRHLANQREMAEVVGIKEPPPPTTSTRWTPQG
ncbi:MAG TPA: hypothetical protein VG184_03685 [Acidimicrobiales bacterium]|nr:hypothetical protein [Acidimicrobiales bacterium]